MAAFFCQSRRPSRWISHGLRWLLLAVLLGPLRHSLLPAQEPAAALRPNATPAVTVDEVDNTARAHLERFERYLAEGQGGEAIDALRNLMDASGERLMALPPAMSVDGGQFVRFVPLYEYCQWRLAALARESPQTLELYRQRVDPLAAAWLKQAVAQRDLVRLRQIVDRFFLSRSGDEALLRLGEFELERGHWTQARYAWERLSPLLRTPTASSPFLHGLPGSPLGLALRDEEIAAQWDVIRPLLTEPARAPAWLAYPDTDLDLGAVRARLALVSILEGSPQRAERELALIRQVNPDAQGTLGGKPGRYIELLTGLMTAARAWSEAPATADWTTFGGNATRGKAAAAQVDVAQQPIWALALPRRPAGDEASDGAPSAIGTPERALCYHPVVRGASVLIITGDTIDDVHGYDLNTGRPLWLETALPAELMAAAQASGGTSVAASGGYGSPAYTLTVDGDRLYVKLGSQATAAPLSDRRETPPLGYLAALDLQAEKKRLFEIRLERSSWGDGWAVEGVPLADDGRLYVALRQRDSVRTQTHIAAFDAKRGDLVWQRFVAAAESFGQSQSTEYTHNLLSLDQGILYFNTNLGVVAAVRASDGQMLWVTRYPQIASDESAPYGPSHVPDRGLTPCLIHQGLVIVAPSDCNRVFALDAATGLLLWSTAPEAADEVRYLLGVGGGNLIASGRRLYWINAETGQIIARFPGGPDEALRGYGRGILAGDQVYWPTRDRIYVFDQQGPQQTRQPIDLAPLGLTGGNLLIAHGWLLIAAADRLSAFEMSGPQILQNAARP